jgi:iron(III) transport system substrate-binding protein
MNRSPSKPRKELDQFAAWEVGQQLLLWGPLVLGAIVALVSGLFLSLTAQVKAARSREVVVYCAQDQVYAEPLLSEFSSQTGIKVRALYDNEAVKTVGLANRLLAEREHPQCDVFWGNEELRTRHLAARSVFRATNAWASVGYRSRRLVVNTNALALVRAPRAWLELTNVAWRGRVALAYPLFGSTATHFLAWRQQWGTARWEVWCRALAANRPLLVDGNSVAARLVARGEAWVGLTDSDDIAAEQRQGAPVVGLPLTEDSLLLPNTVAVVRAAPHAIAAQRLFEFLQTPTVRERLVAAHALESTNPPPEPVRTLRPDWDALLRDLDAGTAKLREVFLR